MAKNRAPAMLGWYTPAKAQRVPSAWMHRLVLPATSTRPPWPAAVPAAASPRLLLPRLRVLLRLAVLLAVLLALAVVSSPRNDMVEVDVERARRCDATSANSPRAAATQATQLLLPWRTMEEDTFDWTPPV